MYNEKTRKLTSLMLMTVMVAGGMTVAFSGFEPNAYAADDELYVSAQEIGNFAGIQVIEIVIDDNDRSETNESEGRPNVTFDSNKVYMSQATDGSWYAYVVNQIALDNYDNYNLIYNADVSTTLHNTLSGTDAQAIYANATDFLAGYFDINTFESSGNNNGLSKGSYVDGTNNDADALNNWPFIQSYDISEGKDVDVVYGAGQTAQSVTIEYDYDDDKDITLDRQKFPENGFIHLSLDDSLLNLSPIADEAWVFYPNATADYVFENGTSTRVNWSSIGFTEGPIIVSNSDGVFEYVDTEILESIKESSDDTIILKTSNTDDNLFVNYDNSDETGLIVKQNGESSIEYNNAHSVLFDTFDGTISFDGPSIEEWLSGVEIDLVLTDEDRNLNSRTDETLDILDGEVPYIEIGNPTTIDDITAFSTNSGNVANTTLSTLTQSKTIEMSVLDGSTTLFVNATWPYATETDNGFVLSYINYDFTALNGTSGIFYAGFTNATSDEAPSGVTNYSNSTHANFAFTIAALDAADGTPSGMTYFDILSFGQKADVADSNGDVQDNIDRVNDAFYRFLLEETDDNTAKYEGTLEYLMINQLNVFDKSKTYDTIKTADDNIIIIVNDDMDGADAITVSYSDTDSTSDREIISVQEDANTHTGVISLDSDSYSSGNTIEVTLNDVDLNTNSDTIQTYDVSTSKEWVGDDTVWLAQLKIGDLLFDDDCNLGYGLSDTGFTLTETGDATGIFVGTLKLPANYCTGVGSTDFDTTNGLDIEFEYQDYSDGSGEPNETSSDSSVRSNTGSVELDATVYPVPFADGAFHTYDNVQTALGEGTVILTIQVNDPDFNLASSGEDTMSSDVLKIVVSRGSIDKTIWPLGSAPTVTPTGSGFAATQVDLSSDELVETDPKSGIFEIEVALNADSRGFGDGDGSIYQGDIITVTYTDPNDASGDENTVTDSATFDLRNGQLQSDKQEYVIGSQAIITLIEPDLNMDSDSSETWSLDLVNWDSDAGDANLSDGVFDANPAGFRETGDNTGIFQTVIEIPKSISNDALERGEEITLEYQDNGPAGADYIGDDDEDISITIRTSSYGASITLDQKVYSWTDKVYVTIVSPDHNFDSNAIDEIGSTSDNEINISTRSDELENYKLVETGTDTGIFTGEIILTGFTNHDADGDGAEGDAPGTEASQFGGPTNGKLQANDDDGLSVSFEASDGDVVIGSALIRWNIGETQWLESSYPAKGSGVVRVIDPDMNWNPEAVDSFDITVWSDSSTGGVSLSVTETNEQTGIFEGTVFFTTTQGSSGSRLHVQEGDSVTAKYEDNTLPEPYSTADELAITSVANIGTIVPPLERAPAGNLKAVDAFGNSLSTLSIDQQIQIEADISNGQDRDQEFAYLVQIQDKDGITVKLAWITGELTPGQNFSPALSWIPLEVGEYTATAFVWESVSNPTALSPPLVTALSVG